MRRPVLPRVLVLASVLAGFAGGPAPATAVPRVDLSWDSCSPIVTAKQAVPGTVSTLYCSVTGMDEPHMAYTVQLFAGTEFGDLTPALPDAWRFDPLGCQAKYGRIEFIAPNTKTCTPFSGPGPIPSAQIAVIQYFPDGTSNDVFPGTMRVTCSLAYPNAIQTPDPARRYQLARIVFDHASSAVGAGTPEAPCGGLEQPLCFALWSYVGTHGGFPFWWYTNLSYVTPEGITKPMGLGQGYATYGLDASGPWNCFNSVPARSSTWGELKARYRE
jgi:hypothetical protein